MAGKSKHKFSLRQNTDNTWSILAKNQEDKEFWHGQFSLKQNAVRWGDSHKIPNRFPQVVEREHDPFDIELSNNLSSAPIDPIDQSIKRLLESVGIDQSNKSEVAEFLGINAELLEEITDPSTGEIIFQMPR